MYKIERQHAAMYVLELHSTTLYSDKFILGLYMYRASSYKCMGRRYIHQIGIKSQSFYEKTINKLRSHNSLVFL